jgi:2-polyprenyl-3-methyl-5-hydroxy-6-metoxy-1,4-benzoquinol methylase
MATGRLQVADKQRATYEAAWALDSYATHSPGAELASKFIDMAGPPVGSTVLDAGCGSGKGAVALKEAGLTVAMCDITRDGLVREAEGIPFVEASLWSDLRHVFYASRLVPSQYPSAGRFDYVYCCDVLEHIPEEFTMLCVARMLDVASTGLFLSVALVPDHFGALVGTALHLTVRPFTWWRDNLSEIGHIAECRDLITNGLYLIRTR